jgi:hypothetical protein
MGNATVPVTITPEGARRVAELGLQAEMQSMIDYALQNIPELDRIVVDIAYSYDAGQEDGVTIHAYGRRPFDPDDHTVDRVTRDIIQQFPPEVMWYLILAYYPGAGHAG